MKKSHLLNPFDQLPKELLEYIMNFTSSDPQQAVATIKNMRLCNRRFRSLLTSKKDIEKYGRILQRNCKIPYIKALHILSLPVCKELKSEWKAKINAPLDILIKKLPSKQNYTKPYFNFQQVCLQPDNKLLLGVFIAYYYEFVPLTVLCEFALMRLNTDESLDIDFGLKQLETWNDACDVTPTDGFQALEFIPCPTTPNINALYYRITAGPYKSEAIGTWKDDKWQLAHSIDGSSHGIYWDANEEPRLRIKTD